ncbi:RHS repeat domain-containing protein [Mucilaginibacter pedocola]|uniref:hypothetical protein n=1 Tax=Mucilaginibacter pedocola TaxID=1792845 RepID=UPI00118169F4|nr:hypothetical protein [Mucilaginibacter pedocola]
MVPVSTVSPNAASLGKFGNIPVSYATGVPSVTIPLYQISIGGMTIPLSLDYHGGGVRVDEVSSSVGTSWALNGIPQITRNMIGRPDESSGYLTAPSLDSLYDYYNYANYPVATKLRFAEFILGVRDNLNDTEPDVYSYTLNGSSGKFIFRQNGTAMQIPVTNNRIERIAGNFKITDEKGVTYIFDQQERTEIIGASGPGNYPSTYRLSKLIAPNMADTVYFTYQSSSGSIERSWNFTYTIGNKPNEESPSQLVSANGENSSVSQIAHTLELFPKEISWRGGKVTFKNVLDRTDRPAEMRLDSVKVYAKLNGSYQLNKSVKLYQSYFYSNPVSGATPDYRNYRLRLDSVAFLPVASPALKAQTYQMTYNNTPIAPNESFGQDLWGYNNGKFNNTTSMPVQRVLWKNIYYTFGEANTDPDSTGNSMQACMLQSIKYPTKGYTVFDFEPHQYPVSYQSTQTQSAVCNAYGSVQSTNTYSFTVLANQSNFTYRVVLSAYNYPNVTDRPRAKLVDQTTGQQVFFESNVNNPSQSYDSGTIALNLVVGHTYVMTTDIYTVNSNVSAQSTVSWRIPVSGVNVKFGGGLRIKSITNYDANNSFIGKETYQYGNNGLGTLMTDAAYLLINYENVFYRLLVCQLGEAGSSGCSLSLGDNSIIYHTKSIYPATQFSGSPVVYGAVTKTEVNSLGQPNGKSVFAYRVYNDQAALPVTDYGLIGIWLTSNAWKNGLLASESTYKSNGSAFTPVSIKNFDYNVFRRDTLWGLKIKPLYIKLGSGSELQDTVHTRQAYIGPENNYKTHFFIGRTPSYTGAMLLQTESDTTYDDLGNKFVQVKNLSYDDLTHTLPTKVQTFNSKGDMLSSVTKYPHDLASGTNVYQKLLNRNMVASVVSAQQLKNSSQLELANINYNDWFGNSTLLLPQTVDGQVANNAVEPRVKFNKYDAYGNILEQQKADAPVSGYKWGYSNQYPIAVATNALSTEFYYEGFEESTAGSTVSGAGHTGRKYSTNNLVNWAKPNGRSYVISYWYRSGGVWVYKEEQAYTGSSFTLTGADTGGGYDDIRIYPSDAQMSTFTYDPLVGMTSQTDAKGQTTYFEYDGFQRLADTKDQDGNIVKHMDYHYQGQ